MTTTNLTVNDILKLAEGDLDDQELASRIARHTVLEVYQRIGKLTDEQAQDLVNLTEVISRDLAWRDQSSRYYKVWIREGGPEGTLFWENVSAKNEDAAVEWAKAVFNKDCVIERVTPSQRLI